MQLNATLLTLPNVLITFAIVIGAFHAVNVLVKRGNYDVLEKVASGWKAAAELSEKKATEAAADVAQLRAELREIRMQYEAAVKLNIELQQKVATLEGQVTALQHMETVTQAAAQAAQAAQVAQAVRGRRITDPTR